MNCEKVRQLLPGYLDGAVLTGTWSDTHVTIGHHLESCEDCRDELRAYQAMSSMMSSVQRPTPPADLALQIRVAAAQRLSDRNWLHYVRRARTRAELVLKNILEPLAIPATGGFTVAFVVFVMVCQLLGLGVPLRAGVERFADEFAPAGAPGGSGSIPDHRPGGVRAFRTARAARGSHSELAGRGRELQNSCRARYRYGSPPAGSGAPVFAFPARR